MPDDLDLAVVIEDLATDAAKWREIADVVTEAVVLGRAIESVPNMVTDGLSYAAGFQGQYDELASGAVKYIEDGATAMNSVADRLDATREEYLESEDDATAESVDAEWS